MSTFAFAAAGLAIGLIAFFAAGAGAAFAVVLFAGLPRFAAGLSISSSSALRFAVFGLVAAGAGVAAALFLELVLEEAADAAAAAFFGGIRVSVERQMLKVFLIEGKVKAKGVKESGRDQYYEE